MADIDMAPTRFGYHQIARMFAENILGDVKVARRADCRSIMRSLLDIAYSMGTTKDASAETRDEFLRAVLGEDRGD
jgi:hypothetical protein